MNEDIDLEPVLYEDGFKLVSKYLGRGFERESKNETTLPDIERTFSGFRDMLNSLIKKYESKAYEKDDSIFKSRHNSETRYLKGLLEKYDNGDAIDVHGVKMDLSDRSHDKFCYVYKGWLVILKSDGDSGSKVSAFSHLK